MVRLTPLDPWIAQKVGQDGGRVSRTAIETHQLRKLQETVHRVRTRSAFYRERLTDAPAEVAALMDLQKFPFTTAEDLQAQPLRLLCVSQSEIRRVVTLFSSGTTGQPKRIFFTADDQELTLGFFHVGMTTLVEPGDRVLILLPCETPGGVGDLLATALGRLGASAIKHGPVRDVPQTLEVMVRQEVNSLVGIPTQVLALARYRDTNGHRVPAKLKSALLTTDYVSPALVTAVEEAWGCVVYNHYGMTEMGLGGGVECQARRGYHLREADLYVEIVDPDTGQPLPEGEEGEVVFTTLTRRGMPLLRYRSGDLSRFVPDACPCGTTLKTLARVRERLDGRIPLNGGWTVSLADLDDVLFPLEAVVNIKATLRRGTLGDRLHVSVQVTPGTEAQCQSTIDQALNAVPTLRRARLAGHLELYLQIQPITESLVPERGKRTIVETLRDPDL